MIINKSTMVFVLLGVSAMMASAQKKILEGTVTYTVSYELSTSQRQFANLLPTEITCYFRGDSSAAITVQGAATIKGVSVFKTNYHSLLIEMPGASKKIVVVMTPDEVEQEKAGNPKLTSKKEAQTQMINGYRCTKISITDLKNGSSYDSWVTNDIAMAPNSVDRLVSGFGGVPIKFVTFNRGIKINAEVKEIKAIAVPMGFFTADKNYQPMSFAELTAMSDKGN